MKLLLLLAATAVCVMGQSRCPSTITYNNQHRFILAALTENETKDRRPEALYQKAAEACYKDCNAADIMSFSTSYWKHRSPMTILDRAAKFLIEADFLQINETYFVSHIAVENEGPMGLGCFALETPSEFSLYPLDDPVCSSTLSVVCGMPGTGSTVDGQKIANAIYTLETPSIDADTNSSSDTVNPDDGKNNHTVVHLPSGINLAEIITRVTASNDSDTLRLITNVGAEGEKQTKGEEKNDVSFLGQAALDEENVTLGGGLRYSVIRPSQNYHESLSSISLLCDTHHEKIGSLYSSSIPQFSEWFQQRYPSERVIIKSWNGDSYGAKDSQCLIFSPAQGVHLGECINASAVLCEK